jgi:hypothetical protein
LRAIEIEGSEEGATGDIHKSPLGVAHKQRAGEEQKREEDGGGGGRRLAGSVLEKEREWNGQ